MLRWRCELRCVALRFVSLRCVALRCVALRCVALRCVALRCVALRCVALRCVALRCVALRCVLDVVRCVYMCVGRAYVCALTHVCYVRVVLKSYSIRIPIHWTYSSYRVVGFDNGTCVDAERDWYRFIGAVNCSKMPRVASRLHAIS